jgi:hypothetical protein
MLYKENSHLMLNVARFRIDRVPPALPNEIWFEVFRHATEFKKSTLSRLPGNQEDIAWNESLLARRSIPLVCRQWAVAGREFLYARLIFYRTRQLDHIMRTFKARPDYLDWCRDVELLQIQGEFGVDNEADFYGSALFLLQSLPRLQSLVINPLCGTECSSIKRMIQAVQPKLQSLHLSSTLGGVWESIFQEAQTDIEGSQIINYNNNWNGLRILSTVDQQWWTATSSKNAVFPKVTQLRFPSLRILCMDWPDRQYDSMFSFFRQHPFLTEVYLDGGFNEFRVFMPHFDDFVRALPKLRVLSIGMPSHIIITPTEGAPVHRSLETIVIRSVTLFGRTNLSGLQPIFWKLRDGGLPACKVIEMHGDFFEGCIDANTFIGRGNPFGWRDIIRLCEEHHVPLVNKEGQELFLWADRHGILAR